MTKKGWEYQVIELDLYEKAILDSDIVKPYIQLRKLFRKNLALELVKIIKNINTLRKDLEKLREEVSQLKSQANRPKRGVVYD